jgi:hypothetical protein
VTTRKLEEIASNLDDISVTLEEIKEEVKTGQDPRNLTKLDQVQMDVERVAGVIEEAVDPDASRER